MCSCIFIHPVLYSWVQSCHCDCMRSQWYPLFCMHGVFPTDIEVCVYPSNLDRTSFRLQFTELTGPSFIRHRVWEGGRFRTKHYCPNVIMQCFSCVEIFYGQFWHLLHFHLDFKSDIIPQHAEGVIWPLCVWKPFKACCGIFWKSVGVTWKWEAFLSFSCAAKAIHLDKSFSVVLSLKIIFP